VLPDGCRTALAPLLVTRAVEGEEVIVDATSGVSGAGRSLTHATHFGTANEDFTAYGLLSHRHTPEIEQVLSTRVLFTPHLAPMTRGILATCYAKPREVSSTTQLIDALSDFYINEPFIVVSDRPPSTKATLGSNSAHLTARYDERTGWVIVLCAIDNLMKGAPAKPFSAPTSCSASTRRRAWPRRPSIPDGSHASGGIRRSRQPLRNQGIRRARPRPGRVGRRKARARRGRVHVELGNRCASTGEPSSSRDDGRPRHGGRAQQR
jgi:Acetylglutamate semialdehyde dehydrogenase